MTKFGDASMTLDTPNSKKKNFRTILGENLDIEST